MSEDEHPADLGLLIDGEGTAQERQRLAAHVAGCAICAQELERQRRLSTALRRHASRHAAPSRLKERLRLIPAGADAAAEPALRKVVPLAIARDQNAKRPMARPRWLAMAASIAVAALVSAGGMHAVDERAAVTNELGAEIVSSHIRSLAAAHLFDVASTDQHTVKPWFDGKLDFSPPVIDPAKDGFPLVGGRLDYLDRQPVAALVYRRNQHVINVFVWPTRRGDTGLLGAPAEQGYNVLHWTRDGMNFWAVSDVAPADLASFAQLLRQPAD
jgi:anti-sigma factor RsiW